MQLFIQKRVPNNHQNHFQENPWELINVMRACSFSKCNYLSIFHTEQYTKTHIYFLCTKNQKDLNSFMHSSLSMFDRASANEFHHIVPKRSIVGGWVSEWVSENALIHCSGQNHKINLHRLFKNRFRIIGIVGKLIVAENGLK